METTKPSRRERIRAQTLEEIKQHAIDQVAEGGSTALSLNAIAKAMGMSGPAIYRYFDSREDLLAALVTDGYRELGEVAQAAVAGSGRAGPARRLARAAEAYRAWALANPYRYELLFSIRPEGYADPEEAKAAIEPAMTVLVELIGSLASRPATAAAPAPPRQSRDLEAQLRAWAAKEEGRQATSSSQVLLLAVLIWTRLHGIISLELAGILADMELDAGLLVQAEVDAIVAAGTASTI